MNWRLSEVLEPVCPPMSIIAGESVGAGLELLGQKSVLVSFRVTMIELARLTASRSPHEAEKMSTYISITLLHKDPKQWGSWIQNRSLK